MNQVVCSNQGRPAPHLYPARLPLVWNNGL